MKRIMSRKAGSQPKADQPPVGGKSSAGKKIAVVSLVLLMFGFTAAAAEFVAPGKTDDGNVTFSSGEKHKNLYTAGGNVTVNSETSGDLFLAGGMITVNGKVEKDLSVAGGNINLNGPVGDDLRVAGGNISINSPVGGDLLVGGGIINITEKSSIGGDAAIGGGNIVIDAPVAGNVKIGGDSITINSKVTGTMEVTAGKGLTFGPNAVVNGKIKYSGPAEAVIKDGAQVSVIEFTKQMPRKAGHRFAALLTIAALIKLLALLIAALVVNRLFPGKLQTIANNAYAKPWHNLGLGAAILIGTPIAAILLMITVLGLYLGLLLLAVYATTLLVAIITFPYFVGSAVVAMYKKNPTLTLTWHTLIYGLLIITLASWIPFIGWLAVGLAFMMILGGVARYSLKKEDITI